MRKEELKDIVLATIDKNAEQIIDLAKQAENNPELGFKEFKTTQIVKQFFEKISLKCRDKIAITGVKAKLKPQTQGPNIAVLGELDAVVCADSLKADAATGAAHVCGHHLQLAAMAGVACGLSLSGIADKLFGNVTFMAVPAEEYVEIAYRMQLREQGLIHFLGGKQELIYRGEFDDVDMAMMIHAAKNSPQAMVAVGDSSNGFIGKTIRYIGREAHAAEAPQEGVNALNAAMLGLMGIHALRETFKDDDIVRVHPIITKGGDLVNIVPADVRLETYVRAKTMKAIEQTHFKVDRALTAGGQAVGAETVIQTIPGYLPLACSSEMNNLFVENAKAMIPEDNIVNAGHFGASSDMGDLTHLIPGIHPFTGGVNGFLHGRDFEVVDYYAACIVPAKIMAMTIVDLLYDNAFKAKSIIAKHKPLLTKKEYISKLDAYFAVHQA